MVIDNRGDPISRRAFDEFFQKANIAVEPATLEQMQIARQAHRDFGKGRHPAGLNFGDCFSYALAKAMDQPLLYKVTTSARRIFRQLWRSSSSRQSLC